MILIHIYLSARLGIKITNTVSLNYSNLETSVTIGESVRDDDGRWWKIVAETTDKRALVNVS